jgi:hypothetical protein
MVVWMLSENRTIAWMLSENRTIAWMLSENRVVVSLSRMKDWTIGVNQNQAGLISTLFPLVWIIFYTVRDFFSTQNLSKKTIIFIKISVDPFACAIQYRQISFSRCVVSPAL